MVMKNSECKYCKCLYFTSAALARKVEKLAIESWKPTGLPPSHGYLLMLVIEEPGIQAGVLSGQLQLTPSTITRFIERLEQKKLVTRLSVGKTTQVYPTAKAEGMKKKLQGCLLHFYTTYSEILGKEESSKLVQNMNAVVSKL